MKTPRVPLYMPLFNYFTALYLALGGLIATCSNWSASFLTAFILIWLYLPPPLMCRMLLLIRGRPVGVMQAGDRGFALWWFLTQLQILYSRMPVLEELLRIVPGLYSSWLNLWGANVSLMAFWSPGTVVSDRYLLKIGHGALLGGGCRIGGHVMQRTRGGALVLTVAPVTIEDGAMVGLHAGVGPGCHVHRNETIPAGRLVKPFFSWKDGVGHRPTDD